MYGIIVDGYSSGNGLVKEFIKLDINCIHIQSTKNIPDMYSLTFSSEDYIKNYVFNNDINELISILNNYNNIFFVVAGSEPGIELADLIGHHLNILTANSVETSLNRRNKFFMHEQLKNHHLTYIPQFKSSQCGELLSWARGKEFPLVVKPLKSAGGDRVKICYSNDDIIQGFNDIINNKPNVLNLIDNEVLIQEYIDAPEVAVNTTHYNGKSYLNEIVQFHKILLANGKKISDYATLLPFEQCNPKLIDYAFSVAEALGIKYGAMHAEIFVTKSDYILIESGARLMGANTPVPFMQECLTHPQSYMTALLYASPQQFLEKIKQPPKIKKNFRIIFLISQVSGLLVAIQHLDKIKNLPSFHSINIRIKDKVYRTLDYDTSPGLIYLCHEDEQILKKDYEIIRQFENDNMYIVKKL